MPQLHGRAKEKYIATYGEEEYEAYNDKAPDMFHGSSFTQSPEEDNLPQFTHRPDHDMESLFWVLLVTLILAKPLGEPDKVTPHCSSTWKILSNHVIDKDEEDYRNIILTKPLSAWKPILHPKLASLAGMIHKLAHQVVPEYGLLDYEPKRDHLHEAFRRILLEQILSMDDDPIPLTPNVSRDPDPVKNKADATPKPDVQVPIPTQVKQQSKKRKAIDVPDGDAERVKKSVCSGGIASSKLQSTQYMNDA